MLHFDHRVNVEKGTISISAYIFHPLQAIWITEVAAEISEVKKGLD